MTGPDLSRELERCDAEIAYATAQLRAGHADMEGLLQMLQDWSEEKRLIENRIAREAACQ